MGSEWREVALSEVADLTGGYAFKSRDYASSGRFVLRTLNISDDGSITRDDAVYLPEALCPQYERFVLQADDTLFVMVGATLGKVGLVQSKDLPALLNQNMWRIRARPGVADPRFIHYAFRHAVQGSLGWASGSAREFVRRDDYRNLLIPVPPLAQQIAIGEMLGALDDKIELNRRMSQTLESMARALFKSWFVDFDHLKDGALDPAGWEDRPLADILTLEKGLSYKGAGLSDYGVPMVTLGCFARGDQLIEDGIKHYVGDYRDRHTVRPGDLLIANTDITQRREVLGSPALVPDVNGADAVLFTHHVFAARFVPGKDQVWRLFAYYALLQEGFRERARGFATGTTVLALPPAAVLNYSVPMPPEPIVKAFNGAVLPLLQRRWQMASECRALVTVRDALLPVLLSGARPGRPT